MPSLYPKSSGKICFHFHFILGIFNACPWLIIQKYVCSGLGVVLQVQNPSYEGGGDRGMAVQGQPGKVSKALSQK
jgi:hypothetical protein